jgi:nicotinate-nucleotide pyrophosphorylase (carboxylating)
MTAMRSPWCKVLPARLLTGERTALNFVQRLSGVATAASAYVPCGRGHSLPDSGHSQDDSGLRRLEKMAAAAGGAANHRMGLFDAVLIKNNHITRRVACARRWNARARPACHRN